ncbi:MAG TPA: 4Fe-4S binding protein [Planctomycetaceae bacterium]
MPRQLLPQIDSRLCTVCGDCVRICPTGCLSIAREREVVLVPQACINCAVCEAVCPANAIAMQLHEW